MKTIKRWAIRGARRALFAPLEAMVAMGVPVPMCMGVCRVTAALDAPLRRALMTEFQRGPRAQP